ncbi:MAG TPA: hypothetical protein VGG01_14125 [Xanthobacteraceae bacterium]
MRRAALVAASVGGGVIVAMIIDIMLARRGIGLLGAWQGVLHSGTPVHAALAWWAITGGAFVSGFIIALVASRISWLYLRSLRWVVVVAVTIGLSAITDLAPRAAADAAGHQAVATLAALAVAMVMAGFGAFFAVRH